MLRNCTTILYPKTNLGASGYFGIYSTEINGSYIFLNNTSMRYLLRISDNWVHVLFSFFRVSLLMCCPSYGLPPPPPPLLSRNIYYLIEVEGELTFGTIISDASVAIISFSEDVNVRGNYWLLFPHRTDDDELHTAEILDSDVGHCLLYTSPSPRDS